MVKAVRQAIVKAHMKCNKPTRDPSPKHKFMVKACARGQTRLIHYGDPNMTIKKHLPAHRKSFRARHKCASAHDKLTARYWSCKKW